MITAEEVSAIHDIDLHNITLAETIEREQAAGQPFGPCHRHYQLLKAPEKVLRLLEKARQHPELVAAQSNFQSPDDIINISKGFPNADLKTTATSTTENNLWDPGVLFRIPAYTMATGKLYLADFGGVLGTTSTPTLVMRARCGTDNSAPPTGTDLGIGPTVTLGTFTAQPFFGQVRMGVKDAGVAASLVSVRATGFALMPAAAAATVTPHLVCGGGAATTINGAIDEGLAVSFAWGTSNASNTWTCQWMYPYTSQ